MAKPAADTAATNDEPAISRRTLWLAIPSWLISSVAHIAALLVLALMTYSMEETKTGTVLVASTDDGLEPVLLEPNEIVQKIETMTEFTVTGPNVDALASADIGLVAEPAANSASVSSHDLDLSPIGEAAELFGRNGSGMQTATYGGKAAEFFGVKASGRSFVFIVDSSNSMRGGKFDDAKAELMYSIAQLNKDQSFYVIFFDHDAARMTFAPNTEPEERGVPATRENIRKLEAWVKTVENELKTNPFDAVQYGMKLLPDAIYLLSDGQFTDKGRTVNFLRANNLIDDPIEGRRRAKVVVHTIGFYSRDGEENLQRIAKDYGGTYRFVPKPDKK